MTSRQVQTQALAQGLFLATVSPLLLTGIALVAGWAIAVVLILAAQGR